MRVSAAGGVATPLTAIASPNQFHVFPSFLQDGRHFVYLRFSPDGNRGIYVGALDATPEQQSTQRLLDTSLMPAYAPSLDPGAGHLLFVRDGTLWSQPFDARRFALAGEAVPIAERVGIFRLGANFSTSANGVLAYRGVGTALSRLTWYDRAGTVLGPAGDQGAYWDVALSPDDSRVATSLDEGRAEGPSISVLEFARRVMGRLTFRCRPGGPSHLSGPRTGTASPSCPDAPVGPAYFKNPRAQEARNRYCCRRRAQTSGPTIGRAMGTSCSFPAWILKRNLICGCCL